MEIFENGFMIRAFLVGILLAAVIPCVGVVVVFKRLSLIADALSHASLAGVAAGLILGAEPTLGAMAACILAALGIECIRRKIPQYAELSIAVVLSAGVGLAGVLSGHPRASGSFNKYLFGSIVAVSDMEAWLSAGVSLLAIGVFLVLYRELFYVAFDERAARLAGVPVRLVNFVFTILTAVVVSVAARTVGALVVSSMMVVPVVCAMQVAASYRQTVAWSAVFCVAFTVTGLFVSYYAGWRPGSTIVLAGVAVLLLLLAGKGLGRLLRQPAGKGKGGQSDERI